MQAISSQIANELQVREAQVQAAIDLAEAELEVPLGVGPTGQPLGLHPCLEPPDLLDRTRLEPALGVAHRVDERDEPLPEGAVAGEVAARSRNWKLACASSLSCRPPAMLRASSPGSPAWSQVFSRSGWIEAFSASVNSPSLPPK